MQVLETQRRQDFEIKTLKEDVLEIKEENANIMKEFEDRERRRPSLILSGMQEKEDGSVEERTRWDAERVDHTLLQDLGNFKNNIIASIHRIGKVNSGKPRLLKIVCKDVDSKRSLLYKAKDLRGVYTRVYLNPDLTRA